MKHNQYKFKTHVWLYPGMSSWHFAIIPKDVSDDIKQHFREKRRGWGSLPVSATIGKTTWKTSIFPDSETKGYLIPLKVSIRKSEGIIADDKITLLLEII